MGVTSGRASGRPRPCEARPQRQGRSGRDVRRLLFVAALGATAYSLRVLTPAFGKGVRQVEQTGSAPESRNFDACPRADPRLYYST